MGTAHDDYLRCTYDEVVHDGGPGEHETSRLWVATKGPAGDAGTRGRVLDSVRLVKDHVIPTSTAVALVHEGMCGGLHEPIRSDYEPRARRGTVHREVMRRHL
jgi:hypothetical protein